MLRKEACSGQIEDLAHVVSADCLADCLTKSSAKPEALISAVDAGTLPQVDVHPEFRALLKLKACFCRWLHDHIGPHAGLCSCLGVCVSEILA